MKSILLSFIIVALFIPYLHAQHLYTKDFHIDIIFSKLHKVKTESSSSTLPIAIGVWSFLYLLNPIILLENDKIGGGITKEVSIGFGYFGEHRASFEYSYIFRQDLSSNIRAGYKYDFLLKPGI